VGRREAGVACAALHGDPGHQRAARAEPGGQAGRLGDDAAVRAQAAGGDRQRARAGRLLVGYRVDDQVAAQRHVECAQHLGREQHARDPALHVAGAAPVDPAGTDVGRERRARPTIDRLGRHDVDMTVEQERATAAGTGGRRHQLRPAVEVMTLGDRVAVRRQVGGLGLPHAHGEPGGAHAAGHIVLQGRLVARRRAGLRCARVEPDEVAQQRDELVATVRDRIGHGALERRKVSHAAER
jgi:hypothetical protein